MMHRSLLNFLTLGFLGLAIGTVAALNPLPQTIASSATSAASSTATTSTAAAPRYCPWCDNGIPAAGSNNDCKLVFQVADKRKNSIVDSWAFVLNHDLTSLVHIERFPRTKLTQGYVWQLNPDPFRALSNSSKHKSPLAVTFVPFVYDEGAEEDKYSDQPLPDIIYNQDGANGHNGSWGTIINAGEIVPGVQSTIYHTTFQCRWP